MKYQGITNTSSQYLLPSEFKDKWNQMAQEMIIDAFPDFIENHKASSQILYELFDYCNQFMQEKKQSIIELLTKEMNLEEQNA